MWTAQVLLHLDFFQKIHTMIWPMVFESTDVKLRLQRSGCKVYTYFLTTWRVLILFCFQISKFSKGNGAQRYKLLLSSPPAYLPSSCWYLRDASSSGKSTAMTCHLLSVPPGASPIDVTASCFSGPNNSGIIGYFLSTNSRYKDMNWRKIKLILSFKCI